MKNVNCKSGNLKRMLLEILLDMQVMQNEMLCKLRKAPLDISKKCHTQD